MRKLNFKRVLLKASAAAPEEQELNPRGRRVKLKNKRVSAFRLKDGSTFFEVKALYPVEKRIFLHRYRISKETFNAMQEAFNALNNQEYYESK